MKEFENVENFKHFPENMKMLTFHRYDLFCIQLFARFLSLFTCTMYLHLFIFNFRTISALSSGLSIYLHISIQFVAKRKGQILINQASEVLFAVYYVSNTSEREYLTCSDPN